MDLFGKKELVSATAESLASMFHTFFGWIDRFSLTPCFSWVFGSHDGQNRFNGLLHGVETVETVYVLGGVRPSSGAATL